MTSSKRMLLHAGQRALLLAWCVTVALVPSGAAADESPGRTGATPLIAGESIRKLREDYASAASLRSTVGKRRALKRIALRSEALIAQNPAAPNRFLVLSTALKVWKQLLILKSDRGTREALLATAGTLRRAPDAYARERLPADVLLLQLAFRKNRTAPQDQVKRIGELVERYKDTPAEADSLITASDMLFDLGEGQLLHRLKSKMLIDFTLDPKVANFLRTRFGYRRYNVRFSGAFTCVDGRVLKFPLDRLGHVYLACYWSGKTPDLKKRLTEIKGLQGKYPGEFEVFSFNLDERPDAGQTKLKELGLDWHAMHLPDGPDNAYFRCYGTDPAFLIRVINANGYLATTPIGSVMKYGFQGSAKNAKYLDLDTYFDLNREHAQVLAHAQSLRIGDFLILDPFRPLDAASPPELYRGAAPRPRLEKGAVPRETLQAIQTCFTPPPERYLLSEAEALRNYEKADRLCSAALKTYPDAPNRWIVYNRGIIARLGIWSLRADPASFEKAVTRARDVLAMPLLPGADLIARFCLAKNAVREADSKFDQIAADFETRVVTPERAGAVGAAAVLSMDAGSPAHLEKYSRMLFDQHLKEARLWSLIALLTDRPVAGRLCRANDVGSEANLTSRFGGGSWKDMVRPRGMKLAFKALDGSTVSVPGKDADKYDVVIFFDLPESEQCEQLLVETLKRFDPKGIKLPTNYVNFVRVCLSDDVGAVKKWVNEKRITGPVATVPRGYRNPNVLRLGIARANQQPNAFIVSPDGTAFWSKTGNHRDFKPDELARAAGRAAMFNRLSRAYRCILEEDPAKARGHLQEGVPSSAIRSFLNGALACIDITEENRTEKLRALDDLIGRYAYYRRRFGFGMGVTYNLKQFERNALAAWLTARAKIHQELGKSEEVRKDRAQAEALIGKEKAEP